LPLARREAFYRKKGYDYPFVINWLVIYAISRIISINFLSRQLNLLMPAAIPESIPKIPGTVYLFISGASNRIKGIFKI
jgi:hypothetical protein